jgi:hypothetical protein
MKLNGFFFLSFLCALVSIASAQVGCADEITLSGNSYLCPGETAVLSVNSGSEVIWNTGDTVSSIIVDAAGVYTATINDTCSTVLSIEILQGELPMLPELSNLEVCGGGSLVIYEPIGQDWIWNAVSLNENFDATAGSGSIDVLFAEVYELNEDVVEIDILVAGGCSIDSTIALGVLPMPNPFTQTSVEVCAGEMVGFEFLTSSADEEWQWTNSNPSIGLSATGTGLPQTFASPENIANASFSDLAITRTTIDGCVSTESIAIQINPAPVLETLEIDDVCEGAPVSITFTTRNNLSNVLWNWEVSNDSNEAITVPALGAGNVVCFASNDLNPMQQENATLTLQATFVSCAVESVYEFVILPNPEVTAVPDLEFCFGEEYEFPILETSSASLVELEYSLDAGDIDFLYNGSSQPIGFAFYEVQSTTESTSVVITPTANGCVGSSEVFEIEIHPTPHVTATNATVEICAGQDYQVSFQNGMNGVIPANTIYQWTLGGAAEIFVDAASGMSEAISLGTINNQSFHVQVGQIQATPISPDGCNGGPFQIELLVQPKMEVVTDLEVVACEGEEVVLVATELSGNPVFFQWISSSLVNPVVGSFASFNVTGNASFDLMCTQLSSGCQSNVEIELEAVQPPVGAYYFSGPLSFCTGEVVEAEVLTTDDVFWSTGSAGTTLEIEESGLYYAEVTNGICTVELPSFQTTEMPAPNVALNAPDSQCMGEVALFEVNGDIGLIAWEPSMNFNNPSGSATLGTFDAPTNCSVMVVNIHGCKDSIPFEVDVFDLPVFDLLDEIVICPGDEVQVSAELSNGYEYNWSGIITSNETEVVLTNADESGILELEVVDLNGCSWQDEVMVNVDADFSFDLLGPSVLCEDDATNYELSTLPSSVEWFIGPGGSLLETETGITLSGFEPGVITLSAAYSTSLGCSAQWSSEYSVVETPDAPEVGELGEGVFYAIGGGDGLHWGYTEASSGLETVLAVDVDYIEYPVYLPQLNSYWVDAVGVNGCRARTFLNDVELTVPFEESNSPLLFYPNPACVKGCLDFPVPLHPRSYAIVHDLAGKIVGTVELMPASLRCEIDTQCMAPGLYVVRVIAQESSEVLFEPVRFQVAHD